MLNHIVLMGRLTADPELRRTSNDNAVASFTLAVDRDRKDKDTGELEADFIRCVAWRGTAEFASRYFAKGQMAVVSGRLTIRPWTDDQGNKRSSTEVKVEHMYFGEGKKKESTPSYGSNDAYSGPSGSYSDYPELEPSDEELPF